MPHTDEQFDFHKDAYAPPLLKLRKKGRAILCIAVNLILFTAICVFWGYLHSGRWIPFTANTFRSGMISPTGMLLLKPLSIFTYPWMIVVVGLLLGVLVLVPLVMAVMYPLIVGLLCAMLVGVVGESPLLGLTLFMGCLVAAKTRLRRQYPFLAVVFGMVPVCVFLYIWIYLGLDVATLLPVQQWVLAVPFCLAIFVVIVAAQIIVMLVRWRKFHPGIIWPVILILTAAPPALFFPLIGEGELQYNVLVADELSGETIFAPMSRKKWVEQHGKGLGADALNRAIQDDLDGKKRSLIRKCDDYLHRYPDNDRAVEIAWLRGQCSSMQCDFSGIDDRMIVYFADFVQPSSQVFWAELLQTYPKSDQAGLARWHRGVLQLREIANVKDDTEVLARAARAQQMLIEAQNSISEALVLHNRRKDQTHSWASKIFKTPSTLPDWQDYVAALFEIESLLWKMKDNDVLTDPTSARAMAALLSLSPYGESYSQQLRRLIADGAFAKTKMLDNFQMALAKEIRNPYERADALKKLTEDERTDTAIEAYYELGLISMQTAGARFIGLTLAPPTELFGKVSAARPNPWSHQAKDNLAWLEQNALRYRKKAQPRTNDK
ncbi:MAG: hypothetical protein KAR11_08600 [Phycisphaerae bacterium]|nr:hypothetical protein [Phycisphaerae bacterium]